MRDSFVEIVETLRQFTGPDLTLKLTQIEGAARGLTAGNYVGFLETTGADRETLAAAAKVKWLASQINVTIHAVDILRCLPHILEPGERIEYLSLGAGSTGRKFDLETNLRVAEFKFIQWSGGSNTIRQKAVFEAYLLLATHSTKKRKYLYLLEPHHALRFLHGRRTISSVLSRNRRLYELFVCRFGETFRTVGDYFAVYGDVVQIIDLSEWLPELARELTEAESANFVDEL